ncbi:MAG TPA: hypothetical protein VF187_09220 [Gemmatimonadales bacterium]
MRFRPVVFASFSLAFAVSPVARRAPETTRYRVDIKAESTIDVSAAGGGVIVQNANLSAWVAVTLTDTTGGRVIHTILDSVVYSGTAPVPQTSLDSARGGMVHGYLDADGKVRNLSATPSSNLMLGQVQGLINGFFPRIKGGAKAGDRWTDTTEVSNNTGGNNTLAKVFTSYTAGGQETIAGMPAMKVEATTRSTTTGTLDSPMTGTMEVEGTGAGTSTLFIGANGRLLGVNSSSTIDQTLKMSMVPTPVPVKTTQTVIITLLK